MTDINGIFSFCEAVGTAAFAVSGAMVAVDRGTDIFGVLLMAVFTALGGGTLRDVLIGYFPPRMFTNFHYVLLACLCALVVFVIARVYKERYVAREKMIEQINNVFDAVGLGVFAVSGARIGMEAGFADNMFLTTFLGATTAIGGGMLRDVLLREMPFVLKKRVYAVAAILGALGYALRVLRGQGVHVGAHRQRRGPGHLPHPGRRAGAGDRVQQPVSYGCTTVRPGGDGENAAEYRHFPLHYHAGGRFRQLFVHGAAGTAEGTVRKE